MSNQLMKCGHVAQAIRTWPDGHQTPSCVICQGDPRADEIDTDAPDLTGRFSICAECHHDRKPSSYSLPFFEYHGPGSHHAVELCKCGFVKGVHPSQGGTGIYANTDKRNPYLCENKGGHFTPNGDMDDNHYCGCSGWD